MTFFILFKICPFSLSINVIEKVQIFFFMLSFSLKKLKNKTPHKHEKLLHNIENSLIDR